MTYQSETWAERVVRTVEERGEFVTLEDGFVYYWPDEQKIVQHDDGGTTGGGGAFTSGTLRAIADELDRRNAAWQAQIERELT